MNSWSLLARAALATLVLSPAVQAEGNAEDGKWKAYTCL